MADDDLVDLGQRQGWDRRQANTGTPAHGKRLGHVIDGAGVEVATGAISGRLLIIEDFTSGAGHTDTLARPFGAVQDQVHRRPGAGSQEAAPALLAALGRRLRVEEDAAAEIRSGAAPPPTADEGEGDGEVDAPDPLDSAHGPSATTVGFVDIAGFAKMTRRIDVDDLAEVVDAFEAAALEVIAEHHGRVVKFIGDAVMYVAPDLPSGVRIGLELQGRAAAAELPVELHCGVAHGPTITMGGDVFGPAVNLASRLTGVARRGTVVIPRECARELADSPDLQVRSVRRLHDLKGIGRTRLSTVRWADRPETEQPASSAEIDSVGNGGEAIGGVAAAGDAGGPTDGG